MVSIGLFLESTLMLSVTFRVSAYSFRGKDISILKVQGFYESDFAFCLFLFAILLKNHHNFKFPGGYFPPYQFARPKKSSPRFPFWFEWF
jgi:hypothetical protein